MPPPPRTSAVEFTTPSWQVRYDVAIDVATAEDDVKPRELETLLREVDRARRAAGLGSSFPIAGYDDLTAAQVTERLEGLSTAELRQVREHERRNANRKSVLAAVERKLG